MVSQLVHYAKWSLSLCGVIDYQLITHYKNPCRQIEVFSNYLSPPMMMMMMGNCSRSDGVWLSKLFTQINVVALGCLAPQITNRYQYHYSKPMEIDNLHHYQLLRLL